jgi:hypothetical protein
MITAITNAPPTTPPAVAPTFGPSFFGMTVAAASFVVAPAPAVPIPDAIEVKVVLVTIVLDGLELLLALRAPYAIFFASVPKKAGVRLFLGQPEAHGFVLQQPKNAGFVPLQV